MQTRLFAAIVLTFLTLTAAAAADEVPGIQDNSLLTEEAYNQDPGVVQHINFFQRDSRTHDWLYTFTQEWPAPSITHQLSYTLPITRIGSSSGIGDVALNYRYQLVGDGDAKLAVTPRFTLTLPTGKWREGRGLGAVGYNAAIAMSYVPAPLWNLHFDAATTIVPRAKDVDGSRRDLASYALADNIVFLPSKRWNLMLETVFTRSQDFSGAWSNDVVVSPAVRWAYNFPSGLQIVPAVGFPIGVGPSAGDRSVILYLSFEHPFKKLK